MPEQLSGVIERITFHNLDTGYCVLRVRAPGNRDLVTVVGTSQQVIAGEYVQAAGEWVTDRTHGLQFKAAEIKTTPPHTAEGIAKYLGSGLVKGVGPKYARRIVDVFGERTLDVIDQSPTFLTQVKGIGPKLIEKIRTGWREQIAVRSIMVFLHSYGIGTARAVRIYRQYGEHAIEMVRANPYRLSTDIWGVGFQTADELALKLGVPRDSPYRAQAAVRHVLQEAQGDGHVALPEELAMEFAQALTQITPDGIRDAIEQLRITDEIVRDSPILAGGGFTNSERGTRNAEQPASDEAAADSHSAFRAPSSALLDSLLYIKPLFLAELGIARRIKALAQGGHPLPAANVDAAISWAERKMAISLADSQREAIREAVTRKVMVVTGGPGTGKTTIVRAILEIFLAKSLRVMLCAPTGRAAKRLTESTGREAKTIHRLLEFDPGTNGFKKGRKVLVTNEQTGKAEEQINCLDLDLLVVDEVSMVDVVLMNQLLRAVPPWACVVLVGDVDQLPSVGAGAVLADLIGSGVVPVARLTEVHRQAGESWIVRAAHAVNRGIEPESAPPGQGDFYFVEANDPATIIARIVQMVKERIPAKFGFDPFRDVQVLTPQVKTELGVINLNRELQAALNPGGPGVGETKKFDTTFRVGDKVMQTRNNYQREVFNGDIGRVTGVDLVEQVVFVDFEGRAVEYDFADLDELQLAYAVSVHKSQGSEYPAVVIPVHTQHYVMLQRNLLYTGITRGRKLVALVGSRKALWRAVTNADTRMRFSLLKWRLQNPEAPSTKGNVD
ncbi:MAG: recD2 2 [Gemmataceae bacterium]|nr:recD2 2 [Gemmataceae bacterium]